MTLFTLDIYVLSDNFERTLAFLVPIQEDKSPPTIRFRHLRECVKEHSFRRLRHNVSYSRKSSHVARFRFPLHVNSKPMVRRFGNGENATIVKVVWARVLTEVKCMTIKSTLRN